MKHTKEADIIQKGGVGILPTDTLYGIVGSAFNPDAVHRIETLKGDNDKRKGFIVLISSIADLGLFGVQLTTTQKEIKHKLWPGPFSILLPIDQKRFAHITHTHSIAFRIPTDTWLRDFLTLSGPVIAPSANPTAQKPAESISEAQAYFGDGVDFYIDGGVRTGKASTLLEVDAGGNIQIHRMGPVDPYGLI